MIPSWPVELAATMPHCEPQDRHPGCLIFVPWEFDLLGGVDVVVDKLFRDFSRHPGLEDKVWIGLQDWRGSGVHTDGEGRKFLRLNLPPPPTHNGIAWLRYSITLGRRLLGLKKLFDRLDIRVINCHFPSSNTYALAVMKRFGLWSGRLILSFHGSDVLAVDPQSHVWRTIASATDGVTACSNSLAVQVAATGLWRRSEIQVIHNGIDVDAFVPMAPAPIDLPTRRYILNVGNYQPRKGQDVLLEAFARIAFDINDVDLILVGGRQNGQWLQYISEKANALGIASRTMFLTDIPHHQIPALMSNALVLVHTALKEAFGLVIIEAGCSNLAVVASDTGGIPEIISTPDLGRLFPVGNVDALVEHLCNLLSNDALRNELGENLHAHVQKSFSVGVMCESYRQALFFSHDKSPPPFTT